MHANLICHKLKIFPQPKFRISYLKFLLGTYLRLQIKNINTYYKPEIDEKIFTITTPSNYLLILKNLSTVNWGEL